MKPQVRGLLSDIWEMYREFGEYDPEPPIVKPEQRKYIAPETKSFIFHPSAGVFRPRKYKEPASYF